MSKFPRPENTIADFRTLREGDIIWHVYGVWSPFVSGPAVVTRAPGRFQDHPQWEDYHTGADYFVFDTDPGGMNFVRDGNLSEWSHNDNYWARSQEDAEGIRHFLHSCWEDTPGAISRAVEEREQLWADDE
jgi:hypothetical protein